MLLGYSKSSASNRQCPSLLKGTTDAPLAVHSFGWAIQVVAHNKAFVTSLKPGQDSQHLIFFSIMCCCYACMFKGVNNGFCGCGSPCNFCPLSTFFLSGSSFVACKCVCSWTIRSRAHDRALSRTYSNKPGGGA